MAGDSELAAGFPSADFRHQIRETMLLGLPPDEGMQPEFHFDRERVYERSSSDGEPWSWSTPPASEGPEREPVRVPCAIERVGATGEGDGTSVGVVDAARLVLTFLDDDWADVEGFSQVRIGGRWFSYQRMLSPLGIADVGVAQVLVVAQDAS